MNNQSHMSYSFCLLKDSCRVYVITKQNKINTNEILRRRIYTEPFESKNNDSITNTIIGYCNKSICEDKVKNLFSNDDNISINKTNILYLKCLCARLKLPMKVVANNFCDMKTREENEDIFYYIWRDDE